MSTRGDKGWLGVSNDDDKDWAGKLLLVIGLGLYWSWWLGYF